MTEPALFAAVLDLFGVDFKCSKSRSPKWPNGYVFQSVKSSPLRWRIRIVTGRQCPTFTGSGVCLECRKPFLSLGGEQAKYCSPSCSERAKYEPRGPTERPCAECGRAFLARFVTALCSRECLRRRTVRRAHEKQDAARAVAHARPCLGCQGPIGRRGRTGYCKPCKQLSVAIRKYGLSASEYHTMNAAQGGLCAICKRANQGGDRLVVDHCHKTGDVRGLLCYRCNVGIGFLNDSPQIMAAARVYVGQRRLEV